MGRNIRIFLIGITLLLLANGAKGQFYSLGGDPERLSWRIIKSENYSLIYPKEADSLARVYLFELERIRDKVNEPLKINPKRIPVVLHPYTTLSNGSVAWAPKRVDLITSPDPYDGRADYWARHLATHELRHVAQIEHYTKGPYKVLYYLLGEQSTGIGLGLLVSKYVMEGDAVVAETELSNSGRGRSADFNKYLRAMYLNDDFRNWDRISLGSYKHFTPDIYTFGYHIEAYMRYQTQQYSIISNYFYIPVKYWYNPYRFLYPIKYTNGVSMTGFFYHSQKVLKNIWMENLIRKGEVTSPLIVSNKKVRYYTELISPIEVNCPQSKYHNQIIAIKKGYKDAPKMIRIDSTGKEHFMRFFGSYTSSLVYDSDKRLYWSESVRHNAADLEDFSVIKYLDLTTGRVHRLSWKSKYFNPAPSTDLKSVAVSEYLPSGECYLTYIDAHSGEVIKRIEAPENGQIKENAFLNGRLYSTIVMEDGMAIYLQSGDGFTRITPLQHQSISRLRGDGEKLYFTSDLDGVLNIYTLNPATGELKRLTNSKYGADYPHITQDTLYYSDYSLNGYSIGKIALSDLHPVKEEFTKPYKYPLAEFITSQQQDSTKVATNDTINTFDKEKYPSKYYSKALHAFRIHSWYPLYLDMSQLQNFSLETIFKVASPGITLLSQNSLGSIKAQLSYAYMNKRHTGHLSLNTRIWGDLNAELKLTLNQREQYYYLIDYEEGKQIITIDQSTPLFTSSLSLYYPLTFNSEGWYRVLNPQAALGFNNDAFYSYEDKEYRFKYEFRYGVTYGQVLPTAHSEIFPRWGFGISLFGASSPWTGENFGHLAYASIYAYLPGIIRGQGLKLSATGQHQFVDGKMYYLGDYATLPKGYSSLLSPSEKYFKVGAEYAVPIYLGDVSLGSILYLKRLQLIPFGEYAKDINTQGKQQFYSFGSDILIDFHLFRLSYPFSMGMRYAHTGPQNINTTTGPQSLSQNSFSFLFNISF